MGSELDEALLKVQAALKPVRRNKKGPHSKYADLEAVAAAVYPLLTANGLTWMCKPTLTKAGAFVLKYKLKHAASGEQEKGKWPLHSSGASQQMGSEVTYARRYCLLAVTGAVAEGEDDDGAAASRRTPAQSRPRAPQQPSKPVTRTPTTGPEHERLRHGTVERTPDQRPADRGRIPPGEDPWDGQPPGQLPPAVNSGNGNQVGAIQQHFKRLHITDRDVRLGYTAQLAGADGLGSTNDLTEDQAKRVLLQLGKCRDETALRALLDRGDAPAEAAT